MSDLLDAGAWRQHFPTYGFKDRDIALAEYESAVRTLGSEERVFLNASNVAIVVAAGLGSLALGSLDRFSDRFLTIAPPEVTLVTVLAIALTFSTLTLLYFADRQRAIVFAARKVIVLRRMLGVTYGRLQLVLPNWRVEGTDEPFAVRLFPGWSTYVAYPYYMVSGISAVVVLFISVTLSQHLIARHWWFLFDPLIIAGLSAVAWMTFAALVYRRALLDTHERLSLLGSQRVAAVTRVGLAQNTENVFYRATLAVYESRRLGIETDVLKTLLVRIEDQSFYEHSGVSLRGTVRAVLGMIHLRRPCGGSTITQQLARTLFIRHPQKLFRRKLVEIMLALWMDRVVEKEQQLELYLVSVRFERSVYGVAAAMHHFFGQVFTQPSRARAFFLIERVSNVNMRLLSGRILQTIDRLIGQGALKAEDLPELLSLYRSAVDRGRIQDPTGTDLRDFENGLSRIGVVA